MYKLSGHSLTRGAWFEPETQPLTLSERDSTSTITIHPGPGVPEIGFNDWLLQDDAPEGPIVWRVKSIDDSTDTETVTVELEHVIKCLEDQKIFAELTTKILAGSNSATTVTAKQAVQYLLGLQSDWVLGDFAYNVSNPYEFDGDSILDGIESVSDSLEDSVWEYDMSVYPFKLHIRQRDNTVTCEMRGERNLTTLRRSISRSGMYTRFYPVGKNNLHIDGDYISENEGLYGRVDKIETDQSKSTKENLLSWAHGRLRRHCEPTVTITISGLELSGETGEDMDRLVMNKVCRVPLPEYATTITERIVKKNWKDWKADKQAVTVTLGNNSQDVTTIIKNAGKASGKAAKGNAKQNYLFEANGEHLYYEVFDDCGHLHSVLEMTEQSLRIAFDNTIQSTRSEFLMTSESLRIQFENDIASTRSEFQMTSESLRIQFENDIASTRSEFQMTSESLRIQFENDIASTRSEFQMTSESLRIQFENDIASTRSEFQMTNESLRIQFENDIASTRSEFQASSESLRIAFENDIASTRSEFQQTANLVGMIVEGTGSNAHIKPAKIQASINAATGTSKIQLSADNVVIDGDLITGALEGEDVVCDSVETGGLTVGGTCTFDINAPIVGGDGGTDDYNWGDVIVNAELVNGNKTLRLTRLDGSTLDFSKAVVSVEWSWSNGTLTVTPKPQNDNFVLGSLVAGAKTYSNGTYTVPVQFQWGSSGQYSESTFRNITVTPSVTAGTSTMSWDSTSKVLYNYGYAYLEEGSQAVATSTKRTSSTISLDTSASWSNGTKSIVVKHGSTTILSDYVSIPASSDPTWENTSGKTWRTRITVGDEYRYSSTKDFTSYYNDGWNNCVDGTYVSPNYQIGEIESKSIVVYIPKKTSEGSGHTTKTYTMTFNTYKTNRNAIALIGPEGVVARMDIQDWADDLYEAGWNVGYREGAAQGGGGSSYPNNIEMHLYNSVKDGKDWIYYWYSTNKSAGVTQGHSKTFHY